MSVHIVARGDTAPGVARAGGHRGAGGRRVTCVMCHVSRCLGPEGGSRTHVHARGHTRAEVCTWYARTHTPGRHRQGRAHAHTARILARARMGIGARTGTRTTQPTRTGTRPRSTTARAHASAHRRSQPRRGQARPGAQQPGTPLSPCRFHGRLAPGACVARIVTRGRASVSFGPSPPPP